ncbi:MAG: hypothetical protein A2X32_01710 [Elusimicrobia bacterium GWC2_64_44]|nr:MAG: hypothetical protein A2X32_01710 [Elusimicrobia bacterium GWC2_64_44]
MAARRGALAGCWAAAALLLPFCVVAGQQAPVSCTYETYNWNTRLKRAVNQRRVSRPYSELKAEEKDPATGCTVCLEDQELVSVPGLKPFLVCRLVSVKVRGALAKLLAAGEPVLEVEAYRPGRTKNPLDKDGNRLGFSNHAYGAAVDVNRSRNGLYDRCPKFGPGCRLIQGGPWKAGGKGALMPGSAIVRGMKEAGFLWGGEIDGMQKDFMHFSVSGY